jgi:hypothetical protein
MPEFMPPTFRLYWLRESGCDAGTSISTGELDPGITQRIMDLAHGDQDVELHLPFLDRREWNQRSEILAQVEFVREGNQISYVLDPAARTRDRAAALSLADGGWVIAPREKERRYFEIWQQVAVALQRALRVWIPEFYFRDPAMYEDRDAAYPLVVYEATWISHGKPRTEFTYDVSDPETLPLAFYMIGRSLQTVLERVEKLLYAANRPELARRYAPVWHEDILGAVRRRPKRLIGIFADEAALIDAVIDLGTVRNANAVRRFSRSANMALRNIYGEDMQTLGVQVLDETTRQLQRGRESDARRRCLLTKRSTKGQGYSLKRAGDLLNHTAYVV